MADQTSNFSIPSPQYAWKQNVKKCGWFPNKETCLKHYEQYCEVHGEPHGDLYLFKRVVIPDGWTPSITKNYQSFRWEVKATRPDYPDSPLLEGLWKGPWFQSTKNCLYHFKSRLQDGFDVPDGWETTYYLVMRRRLDNEQ
jgi:hypothetical protein